MGGLKSHSRIASRIEAAVDSLSEPEESNNLMSNPEFNIPRTEKHPNS